MARLNNLYTKYKKTTLHPMYGDWTIVDVNGDGDYVSVTDAFNDGKYDLFLQEGDHYLTESIYYDLDTMGNIPLRIHGVTKATTRLILNTANVMHQLVPYTQTGYTSNYDYSLETPDYYESVNSITVINGSDKVYADNFNWNTLATAYPSKYSINVGDCIVLNNNEFYEIISIDPAGAFIVLNRHNISGDFINQTYWIISKEIKLNLENITIFADASVIDTFEEYNTEFIIFPSGSLNGIATNSWCVGAGISCDIKCVDFYGGNTGNGDVIRFSYDGVGSISTVNNFNTLSKGRLYLPGLSATNCYFDEIELYNNSTLINCVIDDSDDLYMSDRCTLIGCSLLNSRILNITSTSRVIGCRDVNGDVEDVMPSQGRKTELLVFTGTNGATVADKFVFVDNFKSLYRAYESNEDMITSVEVIYTPTGVRYEYQYNQLDFSKIKRYYGTFTQDGVTDHTIFNFGTDNVLFNNEVLLSDNLSVWLVSSGQTTTSFIIDTSDLDPNQEMRLNNSWTILSPYLYEGKFINNRSIYFPYVYNPVYNPYYTFYVQAQIRDNISRFWLSL